jgi:hypothetical protein
MIFVHADGLRQVSLAKVAPPQLGLDLLDSHTTVEPDLARIAITIIANYDLLAVCDCRILPGMHKVASSLIDALGGTTAVSKLTEAPLSTVHSWRKNGIPRSRLSHLRLAVRASDLDVDFDQLACGATPVPVTEPAEAA